MTVNKGVMWLRNVSESSAVLGLVPRAGPRRVTPEVGENLVTLLELMVPPVEVNVEHDNRSCR